MYAWKLKLDIAFFRYQWSVSLFFDCIWTENISFYLFEGIVAFHMRILFGREGDVSVRFSKVRGVGGERSSGGPGDRSVPGRCSRESGASLSGNKTKRRLKTRGHWLWCVWNEGQGGLFG